MKTLLLLSLLNISTMAIGQQRTTTPVGRKSSSSAVKPTPKSSLQASPSAQPAQSRQQPAPATRQAPYDTYQADRTNVTVIKLNFMGLILGGVNLDVEKRIAPKTSVILTGGIYPYGVLKGSYRVGLDFRQYLGESYVPKGLFVSAGGLYHFIPYDNNTTSAGLVNLRALIGYQFVTGHFTFEVAGGPAYGLIITDSKNLSDDQTRISVGLLPAFKASIGYAF